ncbi:hypothetical protein [Streptomyces sp. TBY4]|uniref:hypothetical protein n=1 Tax=Streptomyces sp. TBY4 TaxID=2962030 RepID=UPI0020B6F738|nr:hypothetical protein [Streptomyces sp. TBY4]MCP3759647.1 hypothetical protein [Streptomyces sp. TBY4]
MSTDTAPRLSLVDLYILGDLIAARLGDTWTKSDDTTDAEAISFDHTAGHTISVRRLWDGVGAQTSLHMEGQPTYNAGAVFSDSEATSDTLLKAIENRLLPALDGHRPKLQQSGTPPPAAGRGHRTGPGRQRARAGHPDRRRDRRTERPARRHHAHGPARREAQEGPRGQAEEGSHSSEAHHRAPHRQGRRGPQGHQARHDPHDDHQRLTRPHRCGRRPRPHPHP